jgi:hypothetical protein
VREIRVRLGYSSSTAAVVAGAGRSARLPIAHERSTLTNATPFHDLILASYVLLARVLGPKPASDTLSVRHEESLVDMMGSQAVCCCLHWPISVASLLPPPLRPPGL